MRTKLMAGTGGTTAGGVEGIIGNRFANNALIRSLVSNSPLFAVVVLWEFAGIAGILPVWLPAPTVILVELARIYRTGELVRNAVASLKLVYVGFIGASVTGITLGILTGRSSHLTKLVDPIISTLYPIPKIALFPIFLVWLGLGFESKAAVLWIAVFFPVYINTHDGARTVDRLYVWTAQNFNASRLQLVFRVILPSALPHIFSGLRVGLAIGFIVVFAAELIVANVGLGHLIILAQNGTNFPLMYAAIVTIAFLGFTHNWALVRLREYLVYWDVSEGL